MGISHDWNCSISSVPKRLCFSLQTFPISRLFFFFQCDVSMNLPSNSNFSPVTLLAILLVFIIVGLPSFLHVCKFIIDTSEPELSCNLILLLDIWTGTTFLMFRPSDSSVLAIFTKLFFFLFSSAVCAFVPESVTSQILFKTVWTVLIPMQQPAVKAQFRGQNTLFFLRFTRFSWWLVLFFIAYFFHEIRRFPWCLSSLGKHSQNVGSLRRFVAALN